MILKGIYSKYYITDLADGIMSELKKNGASGPLTDGFTKMLLELKDKCPEEGYKMSNDEITNMKE